MLVVAGTERWYPPYTSAAIPNGHLEDFMDPVIDAGLHQLEFVSTQENRWDTHSVKITELKRENA